MKQLIILLSFLVAVQVSAQERRMLSAIDAHLRMQGVMLDERAPEARTNIPAQDLFVQASATQPERQMLSAIDAHTRMQGIMLNESVPFIEQQQTRMPQWYSYPPVQYAAVYAPAYYVAPYPQQYSQSVADWLFGTPRAKKIPVEVADLAPEAVQVAAVIAPQPKPRATPTPEPAPGTTQPDLSAIAPADAARIAAEQMAAEQAAAEQHLALLAQETRRAQRDAFRWMGLTIAFGVLTGGICLYIFWHAGYKEG